MKIDSVRQLDRLMAVCRKRGVTAIKIDGIEFTLTEELPQRPLRRSTMLQDASNSPIETPDTLSQEDLLFYSASGQTIPDNV